MILLKSYICARTVGKMAVPIWTTKCVLKSERHCHALKFSYKQYTPRLSTASIQRLHSTKPENPVDGTENWTEIYRFPYIVYARLLNRAKLYQTCFVVSLTPIVVVSYNLGYAPLEQCVQIIQLSALAGCMLYVCGTLFSRLIGIIYINERKDLLKIAQMTFFGNRKDIICPVEDVKPISETQYNENDIYLKFSRYGNDEHLYFCVKYGGVKDSEEMKRIFGRSLIC